MLFRLGRTVVHRRRRVLVAAALVLLAALAYGGSVSSKLDSGGFGVPGSQSFEGARALDREFHAGDSNLVLLVSARTGSVDGADVAAAGRDLTTRVARAAGVDSVVSYWTTPVASLVSRDGRQALVLARIAGDDDEVARRVGEIEPALVGTHGPITVAATGQAAVNRQIAETVRSDLARTEAIAMPVTLVLLVFVFGSVVAAALPVAIGALAVGGTLAALTALAAATHVSIFALNLTTSLGLGLAIDYSLFAVSRFREELRTGASPSIAAVRTVQTAGRTVLFSAATVAASLSALLVFPPFFLRSFAYAGIAVVVIAAAGAVVVLPALLALLGPRVDRLDVRRLFRRAERPASSAGDGFWHRLATLVMRRPIPIATAVIALLLVLGAPFLGVRLGQSDARVLPPGAATRVAAEEIAARFGAGESNAFAVVAAGAGNPALQTARIDAYAAALSRVRDVARVDGFTGSFRNGERVTASASLSRARFTNGRGTWLSVVPVRTLEPLSSAGEQLVHRVRDVDAPWTVDVTGAAAQLVDGKASIFSRIPIALGIIAAVTFVALFAMFGSLLVPVKAIVLNLLSLSATFGAMVWVFQEGHGAGLLHFTPTGTLDINAPILVFCIAFGLSMDYEVFLLSRIKEEHDRGAGTAASVATGLERTGRIVTAAAALLGVVFVGLGASDVAFIKLFGVGLTLAVVMDATLIRGLLVPAFMRLAGNANWWAPRPLRRLHERFGVSESVVAPAEDRVSRDLVGASRSS